MKNITKIADEYKEKFNRGEILGLKLCALEEVVLKQGEFLGFEKKSFFVQKLLVTNLDGTETVFVFDENGNLI